jgi:hypothetical protein
MKLIKDREQYLKEFEIEIVSNPNIDINEALNNQTSDKLKSAFQTALDTRKFEIELYWKRTTYFWAFIAFFFTMYVITLNSDNINDHKHITIIISLIGYLFSLGWYFVNRGSKYWQENWERHVANLEGGIQGDLFKVLKMPETNLFTKPFKEYPFSVSKVNQFLSLAMSIIWFGTFIYSLFFSYGKTDKLIAFFNIESTTTIFVLWAILILGLTAIFIKCSKSFLMKDKDIKALTDNEKKDNIFIKN